MPAAAVIQRVQALIGITGRKARVGGLLSWLFIFLVFLVISCFPIGIISSIAIISIATYMLFHIFWWENSIQWNFIETIIDYIKKTRRYYYGVFLAVYLGLSTVAYYYAYKYDFKGYLLKPVEYFDKTTLFAAKNGNT